jgi:hypothetical protein
MGPYHSDSINQIYDLLFCDDVELYRSTTVASHYPWTEIFRDDVTDSELQNVIDDPQLESRQKLLAANKLHERGNPLPGRRIFGVIVEVGLEEGLDVLAAYEDGTARYINYSEKLIVWDVQTTESNQLVVDLFLAARKVVDRIGPWDRERLPPPKTGNLRMTFLVSNGLYFGEGSYKVLAKDSLGGPVFNRAAKLMSHLVNSSVSQSR